MTKKRAKQPARKPAAKKQARTKKGAMKKRAMKKRASRDVVVAPTVEQIEESIAAGTSIDLSEFVKGIKL